MVEPDMSVDWPDDIFAFFFHPCVHEQVDSPDLQRCQEQSVETVPGLGRVTSAVAGDDLKHHVLGIFFGLHEVDVPFLEGDYLGHG